MEGREVISNSGVTVVKSDATRTTENLLQAAGSTPTAPPQYGVAAPSTVAAGVVSTTIKKKRGRPRKYALDGPLTAKALSPKPISSLVQPPVIDFSAAKRGKFRLDGSSRKPHQPKIELANLTSGDKISCLVGANFTPHIITVNAGEDVMMKVISFSQQGPRAICILSANGVVSSVTLRQSDSSGGTLTYEGRFEILSLTGSFMPTENGGMKNRSGGMSVSLASPDGRVMGGGVAGLLVAASPVQIVVGSFFAGSNHLEQQKVKIEKQEQHVAVSPAPTVPFTISRSAEANETAIQFNWSSSLPSDSTTNKPADVINIVTPPPR